MEDDGEAVRGKGWEKGGKEENIGRVWEAEGVRD